MRSINCILILAKNIRSQEFFFSWSLRGADLSEITTQYHFWMGPILQRKMNSMNKWRSTKLPDVITFRILQSSQPAVPPFV